VTDPEPQSWLGFIELLVVMLFAVGWGILELYTLRLDRKKEEAKRRAAEGHAPE
jgi:hypothetical protein